MSEVIPMVVCILVISVVEIRSRRPARARTRSKRKKGGLQTRTSGHLAKLTVQDLTATNWFRALPKLEVSASWRMSSPGASRTVL